MFILFSSLSLIFEELFLIVSGLGNWYQDCQGGRVRERDHFTGIEGILEKRDKELFKGIWKWKLSLGKNDCMLECQV